MRKYNLYNKYHLGDNIFNMIFLGNIINSYILENDIEIYYYCQKQYINQVIEFNNCKNVIIKDINDKPNNCFELWINSDTINYRLDILYSKVKGNNIDRVFYDLYYVKFFNKFSNIVNFDLKIYNFFYKDRNLIERYKNIKEKYNLKYKKIDILILNSEPFSGQYSYNKNEWDNYIIEKNNKYKIITTTKVNGINCTMDDNLTVKDIAALSINVKVIIAVNSGVVPGILNKYTLNNVKRVFIFDDRCKYSYSKFENKDNIYDITFDELNKYIKLKNT